MNKLQDHSRAERFALSKFGIRVVLPGLLCLAASWNGGQALAAENTFTLANVPGSSKSWSVPTNWTGGPSGEVPLTILDKAVIPGSATSFNLVANLDDIHVSEFEVLAFSGGRTQRLEASGTRSVTIDKLIMNGTYTFVVRNGGNLSLEVGALEFNSGTMEVGGGLSASLGLESFLVTGSSVVKGALYTAAVNELSLGNLNIDGGSIALGGRGASSNVLTVSSLTGNGTVQVSQGDNHFGTAGELEIDSANADPVTFSGTLRDYSNADNPAVLTVTKKGTGDQILTGTLSYTGATTIEGGSLIIGGSATANNLNATSGISITGGALDYRNNSIGLTTTTVAIDGGTLLYNSTQAMTAAITFTSGTIGGTGEIDQALTIGAGMTLSPGNSPGSQTFGDDQAWTAGGNYNWQLYDADGAAGAGYDTLVVSGTLDLMDLTSSERFNLNLWSLSSVGPDGNGAALNFNPETGGSWLLVSAGQIDYDTDFDIAALFDIHTSAFNGTGGFANPGVDPGSFSVSVEGGELWLNYAPIPEPGAVALGGLGLLMLGLRFHPTRWKRG